MSNNHCNGSTISGKSENVNSFSEQDYTPKEWEFRGQYLPAKVYYLMKKKMISVKDILLLSVVDTLVNFRKDKDGLGCWISNETLKNAIDATGPWYISRRIAHLNKLGVLLIVYVGEQRYLELEWSRTAEERNNLAGPYGEACRKAYQKLQEKLAENGEDNEQMNRFHSNEMDEGTVLHLNATPPLHSNATNDKDEKKEVKERKLATSMSRELPPEIPASHVKTTTLDCTKEQLVVVTTTSQEYSQGSDSSTSQVIDSSSTISAKSGEIPMANKSTNRIKGVGSNCQSRQNDNTHSLNGKTCKGSSSTSNGGKVVIDISARQTDHPSTNLHKLNGGSSNGHKVMESPHPSKNGHTLNGTPKKAPKSQEGLGIVNVSQELSFTDIQARKLYRSLKEHGKLMCNAKMSNWSKELQKILTVLTKRRQLSQESAEKYLEQVLDLYLCHYHDRKRGGKGEFMPRAYSGASFFEKFVKIEECLQNLGVLTEEDTLGDFDYEEEDRGENDLYQ